MGEKAVKASKPVEPRKPEFGDKVRYVDKKRVLDASIMVAFSDGSVNLRVIDPENPWGFFDVKHPEYDVSKAPGTYHWED